MSTRDLMGSIQSFHDERQEECEDNIYHVVCYHCGMEIDPNEEPVYCWNVEPHGAKQIFVCEGCDAEHRTNLKTVLQVKEWRRDNG